MKPSPVFERFSHIAKTDPSRPAIVEDHRITTYKELHDLALETAKAFPEGISRIGVILPHGRDMIAALLAVLSAGAAYIPAEPDFPTRRIERMMKEGEAQLVLFSLLQKEDKASSSPLTPLQHPVKDLAYILFTSGTTGLPKGVCITSENVCHYARAFQNEFALQPGDVMLQNSVCSFDIFTEEVFGTLLNKGTLAIPDADTQKDFESLMEFCRRHTVTIISAFPYFFQKLNALDSIPESLRLLISGGDVLRLSYVDKLIDKIAIYNTYGPSETTVCASYFNCTRDSVLPDGTFPIGKPVLGSAVVLLDKDGNFCSEGQKGEICILGKGVGAGYTPGHEAEARHFFHTPRNTSGYRSGDIGSWDPEGNLLFYGRNDRQIMIEGKRVELQEVENRLMSIEGIEQAAVLAFDDSHGHPYMCGYIAGSSKNCQAILKSLKQDLTPFMIPEFLVWMERLPVNDHGKTDTRALPVVLKEGKE